MTFHKSFDPTLWIPINIFGFLCILFMLSAIAILIYQLQHEPLAKTLMKQHKCLSLCALLSFVTAIIFDNLYVIFVKYPSSEVNADESWTGDIHPIFLNFWTLCLLFWNCGYCFTYLLFWNRLQICFAGSMYEVNHQCTNTFHFILSIYVLAQWTTCICWLLVTVDKWTWSAFTSYYYPVLWIRFISDAMLNGFIVYLFTTKLYKLILFSSAATQRALRLPSLAAEPVVSSSSETEMQETDHNHNYNPSSTAISTAITPCDLSPSSTDRLEGKSSSIKMSVSSPCGNMSVYNAEAVMQDIFQGSNRHLFELLIKQFVLSMITILSTQIFTISEVIEEEGIKYAERTGEFQFYYDSYVPYHILRSADSIVSTLYIMLSFNWNADRYNQICGLCQSQCKKKWQHIVETKRPGLKETKIEGNTSPETNTKSNTTNDGPADFQ